MKIPDATYRIQFNADFTFHSAAEIAPYLSGLGISHIYASPVFKAVTGSRHGYNIADYNALNPELGGESGFEALAGQLNTYGMGWIQDIVPNHMAYHYENGMLMDILENGPDSPYYSFFDIDWDHFSENLRGRLLAPFLGDRRSECLKRREITLKMNRRPAWNLFLDILDRLKLFDLNLVDPDNRRPVAYSRREHMIQNLAEGGDPLATIADLLANWRNGQVKLFLILKALAARKQNSGLFKNGAYTPLETGGAHKNHVLAFARHSGRNWCIAAAPRLLTGLVYQGQMV